jgi:hypothetical protein
MSREIIYGVEYCCTVSWCRYNFGDPDCSREFDLWTAQVRVHLQNFHNHRVAPNAYLNDLLRPVYSTAHGDRSPADAANRSRSLP